MKRSRMFNIEKTIEYYDINAKKFSEGTFAIDFSVTQNRFLCKLSEGAFILDFGCGSGRDAKFFVNHGFEVEAVDGSLELCKLASEYTGIRVKQMFFEDLEEVERYDGIWACASILHVPSDKLPDVMTKMVVALKANGIIYTSFKYGDYEGLRNGRFFTDMTEDVFAGMLKHVDDVEIEEQWITLDARPGRGDEKWLNLILRKSNIH